ncbi:MAG: methylenetetrahydrofolate reductase [Pseudonocardiaceae bacterium]
MRASGLAGAAPEGDQSAHVQLSSFAGSLLARAAGVEPVMQLTCRDRNRIALQSDLISAATLGIPNILLLTGDHSRFGDHPDAKAVFDLGIFEHFMTDVRDLGIDHRCGVIAGVGPVRSLRALEYIATKMPGIHVPEAMVRRLRGVPAHRVADEGMAICVEIIQRLTEIPGVAGAHVMAFGYEQDIPELLERAGSA